MKCRFLYRVHLLILIIWLFSELTYAQVAVKMGGNIATMTSDGNINTNSGFLFRFHMGVIGKPVRITDSWYFEPEFLLSWKGQKYTDEFSVLNTTGVTYHLSLIHI